LDIAISLLVFELHVRELIGVAALRRIMHDWIGRNIPNPGRVASPPAGRSSCRRSRRGFVALGLDHRCRATDHPRHMSPEPASGSRLLTIGYQGRSLSDLVRRLRQRRVVLLVDVREIARSRRPEFNAAPLAAALERAGIRYEHAPQLGSPTRLRKALYESGDFERFAGLYLAFVRRWRTDDVADLARVVRREGTVCILCYESDAELCHRHIVATEALRARGGDFIIEHL
jgi:uncharacterized protein (DUF488 family)